MPTAVQAGTGPGPLVPPPGGAIKVLLTGGFGAGKTTLVHAVSEIAPVTTEVRPTAAAAGIDPMMPAKTTTTVAMDFGRLALPGDMMLYVFGMPGQARFWFMWDSLANGAAGAVVLVDTRRLSDSFTHIDYCEKYAIPFIVAINPFHGERSHTVDEVREALELHNVPVLVCDARDREQVVDLLVCLVQHILRTASRRPSART